MGTISKNTELLNCLFRRVDRLKEELAINAPSIIIKNELRLIRDMSIELLDLLTTVD